MPLVVLVGCRAAHVGQPLPGLALLALAALYLYAGTRRF